MWTRVTAALLVCAGMAAVAPVFGGINSTIPVSEQSASSFAASVFPVSVPLEGATLYLTEPRVLFLDSERIGIRLRFQAYDHRPEAGIAISETGLALLSGRPAYDRATRQVLLHAPRMDEVTFDRDNQAARQLSQRVRQAWSSQFTDTVRSDLPPHPYLTPLRDHLADIIYDGRTIKLLVVYQ